MKNATLILVLFLSSFFYSQDEFRNNLAIDFAEKGEYKKADSVFSIIIKADSLKGRFDYSYYFNRGKARLEINYFYGAIEDFDFVINLKPSYKWAYSNRAFCKQFLDSHSEALKDINTAISLNSTDLWDYRLRITINFSTKDYKTIIKDCNHLLSFEDNLDYHSYLSLAYSKLGNYEKAKVELKKTEKQKVDSYITSQAKLYLYFKLNSPQFCNLVKLLFPNEYNPKHFYFDDVDFFEALEKCKK